MENIMATARRKRVTPKPPTRKTSKAKATAKTTKTRKTAASKPAAKTTTRTTRTRKTAAKATPKKTAARKPSTRTAPAREVNEHGFVPGTDSAVIADMLLAGGKDRSDINAKIAKKIDGTTRNGTPKNIPALVSGVLNSLLAKNYKVEASWTLVEPARKRKTRK
jgi:hypothetical protein